MLQWVTDGGLETDLIFHRGVDLPDCLNRPYGHGALNFSFVFSAQALTTPTVSSS